MCFVTFDWGENDAKKKFNTYEKKQGVSWAIIEVTEVCNFNCKWCYANAGIKTQPLAMNINKAKSLIDALSEEGISQITLSGGEPLLYPHLEELISYANDYNLVIHMNTNGYFLTRKKAMKLKTLGLSQVQMNIDSLNYKIHDYIRGKNGSFERVMKAFEHGISAGMTCVSQTVLTKKNEHEILDIFKFARSVGVQRCRVWDMAPSDGCAKDNNKLIPNNYFNILKQLDKFAYDTGATHIESGNPVFPGHYETKLDVSGALCAGSAGLVSIISVKGDVTFCCTQRKPMYNIFSVIEKGMSITHAHKLRVKQYLKQFFIEKRCQRCNISKNCNGGCITRREFDSQKIDYGCPTIMNSSIQLNAKSSC